MAEEKKYNLSILGDLQPKLIGFITAIVSFLTFVQSFINETSTLLGIGLWWAYILFIVLYFIVPVFLVCLFIIQNRNFIKKRILKTERPFKPRFLLVTILMSFLLFGFIYLAFTILPIFVGLILTSLITVIFFSITVYRIIRRKRCQEEDKEYLITVSLLLILITSFLINSHNNLPKDNIQDPNSAKRDYSACTILGKYKTDKVYNGKLDSVIKALEDRSEQNNMEVANYPYPVQKKINTLNKHRVNLDQDLLRMDTLIKSNYTKAMDIISKQSVDSSNIDSLKQIQSVFNAQADTLISRFQKPYLDTAAIEYLQKKMKFHTDYVNGISFFWNSQISEKEKEFKKEWLPYMLKLQFKGLVWLFFTLFILFSLLYHYRKQDRLARSAALKNTIQHNANTLKDYSYLIVLLIIPFFKTFTEENISFEKPFLNIGIKELIKTDKNVIERNGNAKHKPIPPDTAVTIIKVIIDPDSLKLLHEEVLEKIKDLGQKAIDNPTDRAQFLEKFESTKKQP
jgi:hypothetical protein